jgi:hypothetical protein
MYPCVAQAALKLNADQAIIDAEIIAPDISGQPAFQVLQYRSSHEDRGAADVFSHLQFSRDRRPRVLRRSLPQPSMSLGSGEMLSVTAHAPHPRRCRCQENLRKAILPTRDAQS